MFYGPISNTKLQLFVFGFRQGSITSKVIINVSVEYTTIWNEPIYILRNFFSEAYFYMNSFYHKYYVNKQIYNFVTIGSNEGKMDINQNIQNLDYYPKGEI